MILVIQVLSPELLACLSLLISNKLVYQVAVTVVPGLEIFKFWSGFVGLVFGGLRLFYVELGRFRK